MEQKRYNIDLFLSNNCSPYSARVVRFITDKEIQRKVLGQIVFVTLRVRVAGLCLVLKDQMNSIVALPTSPQLPLADVHTMPDNDNL
jgi:hypothetical protein